MATSTYVDVDKLIVGSRVQIATAQLRPPLAQGIGLHRLGAVKLDRGVHSDSPRPHMPPRLPCAVTIDSCAA